MREEQHEILDSKITLHDRHRFEIKLDMDLDSGLPDEHAVPHPGKNVYQVETYFFTPRALNINPNTYSKSDFYNSSQKYIRFKTPQITLKQLVDPAVEISPLNRIGKALSRGKGLDIVYNETKLLGCVSRVAVREWVRYFTDEISRQDSSAGIKSIEGNALEGIRDIRALICRVRTLHEKMSNPAIPVRLKECFTFFDEFFSLTIEDYLTVLLESMHKKNTGLRAVEESLMDIILAQSSYRKSMGYPSVIEKGAANEVIIYRRGVLKKFISSILYLPIEISEWQGTMEFFFGLSAGIAMLFVVLVMFYTQSRYAADSIPFVVILVLSYIFKDRIKDWLKLLFSRGMTRWIADRKVNIRDPQTGRVIGVFKEAFSFLKAGSVPQDILRRRNMDNITSVDEEGKPERVFKYEREVALYSRKIFRTHERRKALNDIMRFNIKDFLVHADDPEVDYLHLDPDSRRLDSIKCSRLYHVNMLVKYVSSDSAARKRIGYDRVRIVLNRDGIVRLEEVPVDG